MDINQLNIASAVFLRQLRIFSEHNKTINGQTAELFMDIVQSIDELTGAAQMTPVKTESRTDFLFNLNEKHFDLRQYIMCRLCIVSWTIHSTNRVVVFFVLIQNVKQLFLDFCFC